MNSFKSLFPSLSYMAVSEGFDNDRQNTRTRVTEVVA